MKTIYRKIFWNFEQRERWLNEMSQSGLHLIHVRAFWGHEFVYNQNQVYQYCFDRAPFTVRQSQNQHPLLVEEGWMELQGKYWLWNAPFKIYVLAVHGNDNHESKFAGPGDRYKRIAAWFLIVTLIWGLYLPSSMINLYTMLKYHYEMIWTWPIVTLCALLFFVWALTNFIFAFRRRKEGGK
jgi:hypothetical protein